MQRDSVAGPKFAQMSDEDLDAWRAGVERDPVLYAEMGAAIARIDAQAEQLQALRELLRQEVEVAQQLYTAMDQLNVHHRDVHHNGGEEMPRDLTVINGYGAWGHHFFLRPLVQAALAGKAGGPTT